MIKILQIGHYCATGGISIHMRRLAALLEKDLEINVIDESRLEDSNQQIFNLRNKNILGYFSRINEADIVHIHSSVPILRFIHIILARLFLKKVVLTIHSLSTAKTKKGKLFLRLLSKMASRVIVVSQELKLELNLNNSIIIPAFIPPDISREDELPLEIYDLIKTVKGNGYKLVVSNAYRLNIYNNQDLYGLDLIIEVVEKVKKNNLNIFFIFIITTLEVNEKLYRKYLEKIKINKLEKYIYIHTKPISFVKLIMESDLVIRATNTDGDAITIRESLFLGKPVIASNVVKRPKKTILFENRDSNDLYFKINEILKSKKFNSKIRTTDLKKVYLDVYLN